MKEKLIAAGVKNLQAFGYPKVNKENIFTDAIYSAFFKEMLKDAKGHSRAVDAAVEELLQRMGGQ